MMPAIALVLILFQLGNVSLTDDSAKAGKAFEFNRVSDIKASGTLRSDKESTNGRQDRRNSTVPVEKIIETVFYIVVDIEEVSYNS